MTARKNNALFHPIHDAHAIAEVIVFVHVTGFSSQDIKLISNPSEDLKSFLPKMDTVDKFETIVRKEGSEVEYGTKKVERVGIELQRVKPDGSVEWLLKTDDTSLRLHCLDYGRWDGFLESSSSVLSSIIKKLKSSEGIVTSIGLTVLDKFVFNGDKDTYRVDALFKENKYLFKNAFDVGDRWHSHVGWFEDVRIEEFECLNQLNLDAAYQNIAGTRKHITSIGHNIVLRPTQDQLVNVYSLVSKNGEDDGVILTDYLDKLHKINKRVLSELLTKDMAERIALQVN